MKITHVRASNGEIDTFLYLSLFFIDFDQFGGSGLVVEVIGDLDVTIIVFPEYPEHLRVILRLYIIDRSHRTTYP